MTRGVRWFLVGSLAVILLAGCGRNWFAQREAWRGQAEVECLKSGAVRESAAVAILSPIQGPGVCGADYPLKVAALGESRPLGYADELRPPGAIPQGGSPYTRPSMTVGLPPSPPGYPPDTPFSVNPAYPADTRLPPNPNVRSAPPRTPASALPAVRGGLPPATAGEPLSLTPPGIEPLSSHASPVPSYGSRRTYAPSGETYPARDAYPPPRGYPAPASASGTFERRPLDPPASYPPHYPANGERVPLSPSRDRLVTGSVGPASVMPTATLACPIVSALDRWITEAVQPAAQRWFGQPVIEIKQISAYSCRGMNGQPGAHISEHAFGNALDIAAFTLADHHTITIKNGWRGTPEEQGFLHDVQIAACEQFTTVLAPGSNVFHYDHIHVDLMRRASGRRICQPATIPGEVAAARARARARYAEKRGDTSITGSIAPHRIRRPAMRIVPEGPVEEEFDRDLPPAVPGDD